MPTSSLFFEEDNQDDPQQQRHRTKMSLRSLIEDTRPEHDEGKRNGVTIGATGAQVSGFMKRTEEGRAHSIPAPIRHEMEDGYDFSSILLS